MAVGRGTHHGRDLATAVEDVGAGVSGAGRLLEQAMAGVVRGRTVVVIAHRLLSAHDADRIAVAADGRVTEHGTHDDLLRREGAYARLWHAWSQQ
jgi:ABC-type multidrug transport system fused ATPase/permease subunit